MKAKQNNLKKTNTTKNSERKKNTLNMDGETLLRLSDLCVTLKLVKATECG